MTRAVGNGLIKTLADAIGTGAVGKPMKQAAGLSTDLANIKAMAAQMPEAGDYLTSSVFTKVGDGRVSLTKNGQLCVTGIVVFAAKVPINTPANTLAFDNALKIRIPCLAFWGSEGNAIHTEIRFIDEDGFLNSNVSAPVESTLQIIITPGIYPIFANKE
jgi:hypothetical protein